MSLVQLTNKSLFSVPHLCICFLTCLSTCTDATRTAGQLDCNSHAVGVQLHLEMLLALNPMSYGRARQHLFVSNAWGIATRHNQTLHDSGQAASSRPFCDTDRNSHLPVDVNAQEFKTNPDRFMPFSKSSININEPPCNCKACCCLCALHNDKASFQQNQFRR